jgi:hypothetical protein
MISNNPGLKRFLPGATAHDMNVLRWIPVFLALVTFSSYGQEEREWRSRDGRTIVATGVRTTPDVVEIDRSGGTLLRIPYASLHPDDAAWALQNLEFSVNDQVELSAVTKSQAVNRFERATGDYAVRLDIYTIQGGVYRATGSATRIMEKVKESGRSVAVKVAPPVGGRQGGVVAVELYTIAGGGTSKRIAAVTAGVFAFKEGGSVVVLDTDVVEGFSGWTVLVRSLTSGRVIASTSSMHHFTDFVLAEAGGVVDLSESLEKVKDETIKAVAQLAAP